MLLLADHVLSQRKMAQRTAKIKLHQTCLFLPEIEMERLLNTQKWDTKYLLPKFTKSTYNTTKRTVNGRSWKQFAQFFYTKVSRINRLTLTQSAKFLLTIGASSTMSSSCELEEYSWYELEGVSSGEWEEFSSNVNSCACYFALLVRRLSHQAIVSISGVKQRSLGLVFLLVPIIPGMHKPITN